MTITARFNGTCKACGGLLPQGTEIEWTREGGAKHATVNGCAKSKAERATAAAPKVVTGVKADGAPIAAFINAAKERGLKYPKARFLTPNNNEMVLSVASAKSKVPGSIFIRIAGEYAGRIATDGTLVGRGLETLKPTLDAIAADPAAAAKAYGALRAACSFCGKQLDDAGSVEVGYGPVCAKHYGLPHKPKGTPRLKPLATPATPAQDDDAIFGLFK